MKKEFIDFLNSSPISPPPDLTKKIYSRVEGDLNPSVFGVFGKLSIIHFMVSLLTLSICPQFGFRIIGEGMGLMHIFSVFGAIGCTLACGFFFLGTSILVATLVLKKAEIAVIRRNKFLELLTLAALSLGFFLMVNAEVVISFAILWLFGSVIGGLVFLEVGWEFKKRIVTEITFLA